MRTKIYNYMKSVHKQVNQHQIAIAIGESEGDVLRELNKMSDVVSTIAIPLKDDNVSSYYQLKWE